MAAVAPAIVLTARLFAICGGILSQAQAKEGAPLDLRKADTDSENDFDACAAAPV